MSDKQTSPPGPAPVTSTEANPPLRSKRRKWWFVPLRFGILIVLALGVGSLLNLTAVSLQSSKEPAGFGRGVLQGVLMPMSFPNLLIGRDVSIYSEHNAGIRYKLGYTTGVNVCGLVFFSFLFWRLNHLRKWARGGKPAAKD